MWTDLPFDLLANVFSYLPPDSLARARAVCRSWRATAEHAVGRRRRHPPWFVALPTRGWDLTCYVHNPIQETWHALNVDRPTTTPIRPIAAIGGLILFKFNSTTSLQLAICNPFTNQFTLLPSLRVARTNPAVGVVADGGRDRRLGFKIYVAGGMSEAASGGAIYQPTVEMYDSSDGEWRLVAAMPVEFTVRLTVWTPNESVCSGGSLYWMTSARAYSVMGFHLSSNTWRELGVPMAERLEFAALVPREGRVAVVGGTCGGGGCVWELGGGESDVWNLVGKVPVELGVRLLGEKLDWGCVKCVGIDGTICLHRDDLGSGIIIWSLNQDGKWEWDWIHASSSIKPMQIHSFHIKGMLLLPNLARSAF